MGSVIHQAKKKSPQRERAAGSCRQWGRVMNDAEGRELDQVIAGAVSKLKPLTDSVL